MRPVLTTACARRASLAGMVAISLGEGFGKMITDESINYIRKNFPKSNVSISAQYRLVNFYKDLGFESEGDVYLEDGIDHIKMILELHKN